MLVLMTPAKAQFAFAYNLRKLGKEAGLKQTKYDRIIDQTRDALSNWAKLAKLYAVTERNIRLISKLMVQVE